MSHKVRPGQRCIIRTVELAFPADAPEGAIDDEISILLTEHGTCNPGSNVLDWRYINDDIIVKADATFEPVEGEIFTVKSTVERKKNVKKTLKAVKARGGIDYASRPSVLVTIEKGADASWHTDVMGNIAVGVVNIENYRVCGSYVIQEEINNLVVMPSTPERERVIATLRMFKRENEAREARTAPVANDSI